jgi:hypothetical protein
MQATSVPQSQLVGTWTLESYTTADPDGANRAYPLGPDAFGQITYTDDGYMSVQVSRAGRRDYTDGALHGGTDAERAEAAGGYLAYAGTYALDAGVVTHHPAVSLFPAWEGADVPRRAHIERDILSLELLEPIQQDGAPRTGVLRWRRAGSL